MYRGGGGAGRQQVTKRWHGMPRTRTLPCVCVALLRYAKRRLPFRKKEGESKERKKKEAWEKERKDKEKIGGRGPKKKYLKSIYFLFSFLYQICGNLGHDIATIFSRKIPSHRFFFFPVTLRQTAGEAE